MSSVLSNLRAAIVTRLEANTYFDDITVLTEDKGDISSEIQRALATVTTKGGKTGLCAVVLTARAVNKTPNVPGPYFDPITLAVHVEEDIGINRGTGGTAKICSDAAEQVAILLHRYISAAGARPFIVQSIDPARPLHGHVAYQVTVTISGGLTPVT